MIVLRRRGKRRGAGRGMAAPAPTAAGRDLFSPAQYSARRVAGAAIAAAFLWSLWPTIESLWRSWQTNPDYSASQLIPLIVGYVIWADRHALRALPVRPTLWGLAFLVPAQLVRMAGLLLSYGSAEQYALVMALFGTALLVLGWPIVRRLFWLFAFCLLLVPLPRRVHSEVLVPLQTFATASAAFGLEALGYLVVRRGNVLSLSENGSIAVAEACSGLRMLTAFLIVGATLALVVRRPRWQKAIVVAATVPVAILANTLRLIATALVYEYFGAEIGERFFHDFAGYTMVPFALAALVGLFLFLGWLARPVDEDAAIAAAGAAGGSKRNGHAVVDGRGAN